MGKSKPLWWSNPPVVWRYAVTLLLVAAVVILAQLLEHYWQSTPFVSLFLCAIMFSAWFGGLTQGLLATTLLVLAFDYYFLPPTHSLAPNLNEVPRLVLFAGSALVVGLMSAAQRRTAKSLEKARDELAANIEELKKTNEAMHDEIAERKLAEAALQKAQANLAHVTRLTTMGELSASIAHEVNQPLTAVVNNANACISLLEGKVANFEEIREALMEIVSDADRASAVVQRVRQLAKRAPVEKSLLDLRSVVKDVLDLARYESVARGVQIRPDLPNDLPPVPGDRVQIQQVLLNLVVNGMDAMNSIEESKRILTICGRRETRDGISEVFLGVQDAGIGIKPEEVDRLFEAFYTTKPQGMGMGLAISRSIIEAHDGRLWAEANQGPGATFLLSLPAAPERLVEGGPVAGHTVS